MEKDPKPSAVTPEALYLRRRELVKTGAAFVATAAGVGGGLHLLSGTTSRPKTAETARIGSALADAGADPNALQVKKSPLSTTEPVTRYEAATTYNNFYEFGLDKSDPARNAGTLRPRPWTIEVAGETHKPRMIDIDTLISWFPLEERIYRFRCVEAWSMVIPWVGFPLGELVKRLEPTSRAKYVAFQTLLDPEQMPGQRSRTLDWPYVEGLRIDEAVHPLSLLAVGLYGRVMPNQNGAPIRLVVPWKYGFKGIKSIVKIAFTETEPKTTWNLAAANEYGFYANVNPAVDHPRWSQASERHIGPDGAEFRRRPTLPFNGYADQVASLYSGMDLTRYY